MYCPQYFGSFLDGNDPYTFLIYFDELIKSMSIFQLSSKRKDSIIRKKKIHWIKKHVLSNNTHKHRIRVRNSISMSNPHESKQD